MKHRTNARAVAELAAALAGKRAFQESVMALRDAERLQQSGDLYGAIEALYRYTTTFPYYAARVQSTLTTLRKLETESKLQRPGA